MPLCTFTEVAYRIKGVPKDVQLLKRFFAGLMLGFRRHYWRFFATIVFIYSTIWTVLDSSAFFFPSFEPRGWRIAGLMLLAGILIGLWRVFPSRRAQIRIKAIDVTIEVEFGDLFESPHPKVVSVTEFFDSEIGQPVSPRSVHGQLINRCFGGQSAAFDAVVERELASEHYEDVPRSKGKNKRYRIGTTPLIQVGNDRFFLCALCHADTVTLKAYCDVPTLWEALDKLWSTVRNRAGGETVSLPLIGGGLSGIGLPPSQLLELILLSVVDFSKRQHIASPIHIVLSPECFEEIDLDMLERHWS